MQDRPARISIGVIGGGFCGAAFALHLLRDHPDLHGALTIFEPRAVLGAGLAYSSRDPHHRVNVAAARMSPLPEADDHFDAWLRAERVAAGDPEAMLPDGRLYPRRAEFGRYTEALLRQAARKHAGIAFTHVRDVVARARQEGDGYALTLGDGGERRVDILVLAVGHPPPVLPPALRALDGSPRLVADPWDEAAIAALPRDGTILIVGTGLTACDVIASLRGRRFRGHLLAVSRRGLLPRSRTTLPVEPFGAFDDAPSRSALALLRRVRGAVAACVAVGRPWEDVIDALRRQGRAVWCALPPAERLRLLRHLRAFWDVHRFQAAPQIADCVAAGIASGRLEVRAASLRRVEATPDGFLVTLHPRRAAEAACEVCHVDAIVACTGPGHTSVVETNPALASLFAQGSLRPDPYALGIEVDDAGRCLDAAGRPVETLFVAGPLARGTEGELMGLPQVSTQPRAVAGEVARQLAALPTAQCSPASVR